MTQEINLIAAASNNGVIGKIGKIPWYLPDDFKYFAKTTSGYPVIMGRKTYESIIAHLGKPLPNRKNIILTKQKNFSAPGCEIFYTPSSLLKRCENEAKIFVIGGGEIYKEFLPLATKVFLTRVNLNCEGDTFFPKLDSAKWQETSSVYHPKDAKHAVDFFWLIFDKINP